MSETKTRFTLRIEEDLLKRLKIASVHYGMDTSSFIVELIENAIHEDNKLISLIYPDNQDK